MEGAPQPTVDDFVSVKASKFNKSQQLSTKGLQQLQYQSLRNNRFRQVSIRVGIWFGTRGRRLKSSLPDQINRHCGQVSCFSRRSENAGTIYCEQARNNREVSEFPNVIPTVFYAGSGSD